MVYAKFTPALTNVTSNKVTQWDYGRILRIEGLKLPTAVRIDFGISGSQTTISRIGITKDGVTDAAIPDSLLEQSKNLVAYVYVNDTKEGKTVRTINIPLEARAEPEEHDSPESKVLFAEAIEMINDVAVRAENAENAANAHADSARESLESTQQVSNNFNETAANAVKAVIDAGTSQIQAVNNTKSKALEAIQAEGAAQLEHIQAAGENIVNAAAIAEQNAKNVLANAIKGNLSGEIVTADDVSPIEHEMAVKVVCPDGIDPAAVTVRRCGKNLFDVSNYKTLNGNLDVNEQDGNSHTVQGAVGSSTNSYSSGAFTVKLPNVISNEEVLTVSLYVTLQEQGAWSNAFRLWCVDRAEDFADYRTFELEVGKRTKITASFTVENADSLARLTFYVNNNKLLLELDTLQIEKANDATEYEAYKGTDHTPASDGTVSGMTSLSPNMTILTDTGGVVIECEYIKDTNKVIQKLADALGVQI